jgi:hypothetical protein
LVTLRDLPFGVDVLVTLRDLLFTGAFLVTLRDLLFGVLEVFVLLVTLRDLPFGVDVLVTLRDLPFVLVTLRDLPFVLGVFPFGVDTLVTLRDLPVTTPAFVTLRDFLFLVVTLVTVRDFLPTFFFLVTVRDSSLGTSSTELSAIFSFSRTRVDFLLLFVLNLLECILTDDKPKPVISDISLYLYPLSLSVCTITWLKLTFIVSFSFISIFITLVTHCDSTLINVLVG